MNYYYINTEAKAFNGRSPHNKWIDHNYAFTSGEERFGKKLGNLKLDDICFMYANQLGVVAAGRVCEHWDGVGYNGTDRRIYRECDEEYIEYRIHVDWFCEVVNNPVSYLRLINIIGWAPISTLQCITDTAAAEQLLDEIRSRASRG